MAFIAIRCRSPANKLCAMLFGGLRGVPGAFTAPPRVNHPGVRPYTRYCLLVKKLQPGFLEPPAKLTPIDLTAFGELVVFKAPKGPWGGPKGGAPGGSLAL